MRLIYREKWEIEDGIICVDTQRVHGCYHVSINHLTGQDYLPESFLIFCPGISIVCIAWCMHATDQFSRGKRDELMIMVNNTKCNHGEQYQVHILMVQGY
jgi:hypothetical protein